MIYRPDKHFEFDMQVDEMMRLNELWRYVICCARFNFLPEDQPLVTAKQLPDIAAATRTPDHIRETDTLPRVAAVSPAVDIPVAHESFSSTWYQPLRPKDATEAELRRRQEL